MFRSVDLMVEAIGQRHHAATLLHLLAWLGNFQLYELTRLGGLWQARFQPDGAPMDKSTQTELEAAAFRRLVSHLQDRTDVQNIDMMNLAGFCRNCLSRWYREAAGEHGIEMEDSAARETVYGMPYADWKAQYQTEATAEQKAKYDAIHNHS